MAKLNSGTRIYGTANVDTSIGVGGSVVINTTAMAVNAFSIGSANTATFYNINGQANAAAGAFVGNAYATLGGASGNYLAFGQQTSSAQWIQSGYSSAGAPVYYSIILNPLGGNIGIGNTAPSDRLSVNGNTYLQGTATVTGNTTVVNVYSTGAINAASHTVGTSFIANSTQLTTTYPTVHTANVTVNGAIIANATSGTAGQVLTSAGTGNVYWSTASGGGGGFTNGQSISVSNLAVTGVLSANGGVGTAGQALISGGAGNTYWGVSSPGYNYSSQFNGAANFFAFASNAAFALGTGDFTIECWVYPIILAGGAISQPLIDFRNANQGVYPTLYISGSTVNYYTSTANRITAGSTLSNNTWYHLAVVKISGSTKLYINGVQSGSTYTDSNSYVQGPVSIGNFNDGTGSLYINALISNVRIVKGTGVYTGAFTVPTSPLSAISGTSLLTCNSITPSDSSSYNFAPINNGLAVGTATQSPFASTTVSIPTASLTAVRQQFTGDGSTTSFSVAGGYTPNAISVFVNGVLLRNGTEVTVTNGSTVVFAIAPLSGALIDVIGTVPTTYSSITPVSYSTSFNGSSQYLTVAANSAFTFGTGDFTIECWVYPTRLTGAQILFEQRAGAAGALLYLQGTGISYAYNNTQDLISGAGTVSLNTWSHIALCRIGGVAKIYLNGIQVASATDSNNYTVVNPIYIGMSYASIQYYQGYISNHRVVKGVGVYTGAFTPPQTPLTAVQSASGASIAAITGTQTSLLTCNGPTIIDSSTNAYTITNNGSATVSTSIVPTFTNVAITSYPPPTTIGNIPFTTDGATWTSTAKITSGTSVTLTNQTSVDFTSIPSWVKRITVMFNGVSTNGTSLVHIQVGSGSVSTTGYNSVTSYAGAATTYQTSSIGFVIEPTASASSAAARYGAVILSLIGSNTWLAQGNMYLTSNPASHSISGGSPALSGALDRVRLTTGNGTDTFDAGSVNILYE